MAAHPGDDRRTAGQFDIGCFMRFPEIIRDRIYSYVERDSPVMLEWLLNPKATTTSPMHREDRTTVELTIHNHPCTELLRVKAFSTDYRRTFRFSVTVRFKTPMRLVWTWSRYPTSWTVGPGILPGSRELEDSDSIREICYHMKSLDIYVHMGSLDGLQAQYRAGYLVPSAKPLELQLGSAQYSQEYQMVRDLVAIIMEYSIKKDYPPLRTIPRRQTVFKGLDTPVYLPTTNNEEQFRLFCAAEQPKQLRYPLLDASLITVNVGVLFGGVDHTEDFTELPDINELSPLVPCPPSDLAGIPLVHRDQGIYSDHLFRPRIVLPVIIWTDRPRHGWVEQRMATFSYGKNNQFRDGRALEIEDIRENLICRNFCYSATPNDLKILKAKNDKSDIKKSVYWRINIAGNKKSMV